MATLAQVFVLAPIAIVGTSSFQAFNYPKRFLDSRARLDSMSGKVFMLSSGR